MKTIHFSNSLFLNKSDSVFIICKKQDFAARDEYFEMRDEAESVSPNGDLLVEVCASDVAPGASIYHRNWKYRAYRVE